MKSIASAAGCRAIFLTVSGRDAPAAFSSSAAANRTPAHQPLAAGLAPEMHCAAQCRGLPSGPGQRFGFHDSGDAGAANPILYPERR